MVDIKNITASDMDAYIGDLSTLLIDCVDRGASLGFLPPLKESEAAQYWQMTKESIKEGNTFLHLAFIDGNLAGCVLLRCCGKSNGLHRAEIEKLMVSPAARRCGIALNLLETVESFALTLNLKLLVLDTREGDVSEQLYQKHGFIKAGVIPKFALSASGDLAGTSIYYKLIGS
ncbi:GNAT family N-acetyltransferase [Cardiobacteriaceae bacterium TAE3-ERU3]|nr:GNAT family N-acetyltransferase [Cardiobacteriaceae bacterium TAE3-ERU3]